MVYITEDMVRRRAEHNECEIFSLEEVSLHQQDIERIEHLDRWCRELKILYLQSNLIARIENVGRLKKLQYLNLALNNIEVIENLEGCESLQKLDLTVNFVGVVSSVTSLQQNPLLTELFLVGNPCSQFHHYRQYVVAALPQLQWLDGTQLSRSERLRAARGLEEVKRRVREQEEEHLRRRRKEKGDEERKPGGGGPAPVENQENQEDRENQEDQENQEDWENQENQEDQEDRENQENQEDQENQENQEDQENQENQEDQEDQEDQENQENGDLDEQQREHAFWNTPCAFTPESRLEAHRHLQEKKKKKERREEKQPKASRTLITADGRVMNVNEPKLNFSLTEDEENNTIVLNLEVYRHMDSSLLDVDVQPTYARVKVKGKVFQMVLPAEVKPDSSSAQRSQTTGQLVLTMARAGGEIKGTKAVPRPASSSPADKERRRAGVPEWLEVDPSKRTAVDLTDLALRRSANKAPPTAEGHRFSDGFVDDPDVPPLL